MAVIEMHMHLDGGKGSQRERQKEREREREREREIADCGKESLGPGFGGPERPLVHFHQYGTDTHQIQINTDRYSQILRYLLLQGMNIISLRISKQTYKLLWIHPACSNDSFYRDPILPGQ